MRIPQQAGAVTAVAGAVLLIAGTMLHPMDADPADPVAAFTEYAADRFWVASHLGAFAGVALIFIGLLALADTLRDRATGWLARIGVYFATAAFAVAAVLQAIDGVALKIMVDGWARAPADQKQSSFLAALAVRQLEIGTAAYMAILFGTAVVLIAWAAAKDARYPSWLGWVGVVGGIGSIVGGLLTAFTGFSSAAMNVSMPSTLTIVFWIVITGAIMWKNAPPSVGS